MFLLDDGAVVPDLPEERARLATTLQGELDALTAKIEALEHSRGLLATIVADIRGAVVGPGNPGDPGSGSTYTSVSRMGPAAGVPAR